MRFLVIIDNGQEYSDHCHATILVTDSERLAKNAIVALEQWILRWPKNSDGERVELYYEAGAAWVKSCQPPVPIPEEFLSAWIINTVTFSVLEVPEWAEKA